MLGRLGPDALAAGALGSNLYFAFVIFGIGLVTAVAPMIARERRRASATRSARSAARCGRACGARRDLRPGLGGPLVRRADPAGVSARSRTWRGRRGIATCRRLQWALLPFLGYIVLRNFLAAMERPRWGVWAGAIGFVANAARGLVPDLRQARLPAAGACSAPASRPRSLRAACMFGVLAFVVLFDRKFRRYRLFGRFWRADWPRFRQLWRARPADRRDARLRGVDLQRRRRS